MKKALAILAAAAVVATAGSALAAGTGQLTVKATVDKVCKIDGTDTLDFGTLNPTTAPLVNGTSAGTISITCTKGTTIAAGYDAGANGGTANATDFLYNGTSKIGYTLGLALAGGTTATGAAQAVTVTGTIAAGTYNSATAGSYTDLVNITAIAN